MAGPCVQLSHTCRFLQNLSKCFNVDVLTRAVAQAASDLCMTTYYLEPICRVAFLKQVWGGAIS